MNKPIRHALTACIAALLLALPVLPDSAPADADDLASRFASPPPSARPWVYWFVMDGNLSREGITADFEALERAGIGGMIFMEVNVGIPQGPVKFMSPEWRRLFRHAVAEAGRLGLQICVNAGPGWTGSGGPWVKPEQSMQHVVASEVEVSGPAKFDAVLPRPTPRPAYFGNAGLPAEILKAKDEFHADVAVLAVPRTDPGKRIADIEEKALYLRHPYSSRPGTKPFLPAPAEFAEWPADAVIPVDRVVDLASRLGPGGRLRWDVPEGDWTILRFCRTSTGANTRPAPAPGLGLESDKFDKAALDAHFDAFFGTLLREIGPRRKSSEAGWTMLHIDSWEMGSQNWTAAFRDEFRRRRGYDPLEYLPVVTGRAVESLEISERFLWDLRQTAQELVLENHAGHLKELGRRHGFGLSIEPYDLNPCSDLSLGALADVPMCEFWLHGFNTFFSVIEAASTAHTCGRPIVAAEAFTSSSAERWQAHPASMKALGDWAFCAGVNRIVFHRYQHQPWLDRRPGMTMGPYGVHWERTQTWWDMVPAYHAYLARCQMLLRRGGAVVDVCYLSAEGAPHVFRPPSSAVQGSPPDHGGYRFDGIAPETFLRRMSVKGGRLVLSDGMSYRVLVLPERETMTPRLLGKVKELVAAGATVVGPRPSKSPSLSGYPGCDEEVKRLADEVWGNCDGVSIREHAFGKGRVAWRRPPSPEAPGEVKNPLAGAKWIWHREGKPAVSAPVGGYRFRRIVTLGEHDQVESAHVLMTADNTFNLALNGRAAGSGSDFHKVFELDVTPLVKPGENVVTVDAENGGDAPNPAGLVGVLIVEFGDGRILEVPTDRTWHVVPVGQGDEQHPAQELGPMGMSPWKITGKPAPPEPQQYGDFADVVEVLREMKTPPDFASDGPLRYTHRRDGEVEIYFVANREDRPVEAPCTFRVSEKAPELWDPVSGTRRPLPDYTARGACTSVPLRFEPHQSWFVVFRPQGPGAPRPAQEANWPSTVPLGKLTGAWEVSFDPKWGGPAKTEFERLEDWSRRAEEGIRYYSGVATYRKTFDLPSRGARRASLWLDLGDVKNLARVRLNGRDLGVVWCAPWRVEIGDSAKAKDNRLEIEVANLWPNRLIGDQSLPPDERLTWTTWNPFSKDAPLLASGLLGPVTLQKAEPVGSAR